MSLVTYEETRPWARAMKQRVETRMMPPWHLDKTVGIQKFQNDISLSDEQIATIGRWVDEGAPLGDPKRVPKPPEFASGWTLGQPDIVIRQDDGSLTAFSAVCTHAGCTVGYEAGQIVCPCHGGTYNGRTGAVESGPPPSPLAPRRVVEQRGSIYAVPS